MSLHPKFLNEGPSLLLSKEQWDHFVMGFSGRGFTVAERLVFESIEKYFAGMVKNGVLSYTRIRDILVEAKTSDQEVLRDRLLGASELVGVSIDEFLFVLNEVIVTMKRSIDLSLDRGEAISPGKARYRDTIHDQFVNLAAWQEVAELVLCEHKAEMDALQQKVSFLEQRLAQALDAKAEGEYRPSFLEANGSLLKLEMHRDNWPTDTVWSFELLLNPEADPWRIYDAITLEQVLNSLREKSVLDFQNQGCFLKVVKRHEPIPNRKLDLGWMPLGEIQKLWSLCQSRFTWLPELVRSVEAGHINYLWPTKRQAMRQIEQNFLGTMSVGTQEDFVEKYNALSSHEDGKLILQALLDREFGEEGFFSAEAIYWQSDLAKNWFHARMTYIVITIPTRNEHNWDSREKLAVFFYDTDENFQKKMDAVSQADTSRV